MFLFLFQDKIKSLCYLTLGGSVAYQCIYYKKDFNGYYEKFLQPASQYLNPELAHKIGVSALKYGIFPPECKGDPNVLVSKTIKSSAVALNSTTLKHFII